MPVSQKVHLDLSDAKQWQLTTEKGNIAHLVQKPHVHIQTGFLAPHPGSWEVLRCPSRSFLPCKQIGTYAVKKTLSYNHNLRQTKMQYFVFADKNRTNVTATVNTYHIQVYNVQIYNELGLFFAR